MNYIIYIWTGGNKLQHDKLIQKIESYINIILFVLEEKEYREYIKSNPLLKKYDSLMENFEEDNIPLDLLEQIYIIVKKKVETF